jgi:replicative DNA helicase
MRLPTDINIEYQVIGAWVFSPATHYLVHNGKPEYFSDLEARTVFEVITDLYKTGIPIDLLSVNLKAQMSPAFISQISTAFTSDVNQEFHLRLLEQMSKQRKFLEFCQKVVTTPEYWNMDFLDMVNESTEVVNEVMDIKNWNVVQLESVTDEVIGRLDEAQIENPSGWFRLDKIIGGLKKQDLILIGGRPSMGKTAMGLCLAMAHEQHGGIPAFISLEMPKEAIVKRRLSIMTGIEAARFFNNTLTDYEKTLTRNRAGDNPTKMYIDDTSGMDIFTISSKCKQLVKHKGITALFVDYLQLIRGVEKSGNKADEVGRISTGLKHLARECNIPVIALAQLNRGVEGRPDKRPLLSDLRDSGQLEQDADVVLFPFRPEYYKRTEIEENPVFEEEERCELIIAKNRNGKIGSLGSIEHPTLIFDPKTIHYKFN